MEPDRLEVWVFAATVNEIVVLVEPDDWLNTIHDTLELAVHEVFVVIVSDELLAAGETIFQVVKSVDNVAAGGGVGVGAAAGWFTVIVLDRFPA